MVALQIALVSVSISPCASALARQERIFPTPSSYRLLDLKALVRVLFSKQYRVLSILLSLYPLLRLAKLLR